MLDKGKIFEKNLFFLIKIAILSIESILNSVIRVNIVKDFISILLSTSGISSYFYKITHFDEFIQENLKEWPLVDM